MNGNPADWHHATKRIRQATRTPGELPGAPPVTPAALQQHVEKYGPEAVTETAVEAGIPPPPLPPPTPHKHKRRHR